MSVTKARLSEAYNCQDEPKRDRKNIKNPQERRPSQLSYWSPQICTARNRKTIFKEFELQVGYYEFQAKQWQWSKKQASWKSRGWTILKLINFQVHSEVSKVVRWAKYKIWISQFELILGIAQMYITFPTLLHVKKKRKVKFHVFSKIHRTWKN